LSDLITSSSSVIPRNVKAAAANGLKWKGELEIMTENVLQSLQHAIQDVIAPDVRELKVRVTGLEKQSETQYNSLRDQQDANFKALMSAIGESKAKHDLDTFKLYSALSERVAALEAARH
jgi:phosphate uptake regulator